MWLYPTTPDPSLPNSATPFRLLFGRDARTQIDAVSPDLDETELVGTGLHTYISNCKEEWRDVLRARDAALRKQHEGRQNQRLRVNDTIGRHSSGAKAKEGDLVMIQESDATISKEGVHLKLVHEKWTGPWKVVSTVTPGLCYRVVLKGRQIRERRASAAHMKPFYVRPANLRHDFEDEYAHFAWGADLGLAEPSTVASPMYTLLDRRAVREQTGAWKWEYRGRYLNGSESDWVSETEASDSFTPLQLDVFHAMWELYKGTSSGARPPISPSRQERDQADRERALREVPIGTSVWRHFLDNNGKMKLYEGFVYGYKTPYYRVRYTDGDWEELNRTEVEKGKRNNPSHGGAPVRKSRNHNGELT